MEAALAFGLIFVLIFGAKYILAGITILSGNKEALRDFGNLCEDESKKRPMTRWYELQEELRWRRER